MDSGSVPTGQAPATGHDNEIADALARLCNAECMLDLTIKAHDKIVVDADEWRVNEALRGVSRLLDGVYVTLGEHLAELKQAAEGARHG